MKYVIPFLVCFLGGQFTFAQPKMTASVKADLHDLMSGDSAHHAVFSRYHLHTINNALCVAVLAKVNSDFSVADLQSNGIYVGTVIKDIVSLKVPLNKINQLYDLKGVSHLDLANKVMPLVDRIDYDTRLDSVKMAIDLPQTYTGKGVYIGFLDWGYDYTHPNYYDTLMENYRVVAAWDQFKTSGPAPQGFNYGTEYIGFDALQTAGSDTANIYSYGYHGGHVAGIAAGGGAGIGIKGVAYESEMLFATFLIDAAAVLDAYEWMYQKAHSAGKRLVINQSWGLYYMGNLDGTSLLSQAIDNYSELGVVFTSSAGNNGNTNFHIEKTFEMNESLYSGVGFSTTSSPHYWGQSISAWGTEGAPFSIGFQVYNSGQQLLGESDLFHSVSTTTYVDTLMVIGSDTVYYNLTMENENPFNNRPSARLRVKRTTSSHNLVLRIQANEGTVHAWNVAELSTGVGNMGTAFTSFGPNSVAGNSLYGIGEPACTESVIAVASHQIGSLNINGAFTGGHLSNFSSSGPLYNGQLKPDISAPGANITSSISSFTDASISALQSVEFNGKTYSFARLSGTSMSSPVVAGIAALVLEANPYLSAAQVKSILLNTAYTDVRTGEIGPDGDIKWGWGKVDAYNAIKKALNTVSIDEKKLIHQEIIAYPNPTSGTVYFKNVTSTQMVYIYDVKGQLILNTLLEDTNHLDIRALPKGTYLIKFSSNNQTFRIVKD